MGSNIPIIDHRRDPVVAWEMTEPLIDRAREAFAAYRGLGREIIDELIFALTRANTEVELLRADRDRLLEAAKLALRAIITPEKDQTSFHDSYHALKAAIAAAEEPMK
jgi:hypothetical protein